MKTLTPAERQRLKGRAHALNPVVAVSGDGLSAAVLKEIETSLKAHGLIKIRVLGEDRDARQALLDEICERTDAAPVQHIGKVLVIYREPEEDEVAAPVRKHPARKQPHRPKRSFQND